MSKAKVKPAPRRRRPQHSDEALLNAATAVFARDGFAAATVESIAAAAGTTKPTLYARFGSKADLYEAAVQREAESIRAHLFAAYDQAAHLSMAEFTAAAVDAWFAFAAERPDGMRLLFVGDHLGAESPTPRQTTAAITSRIAEAVEDFSGRAGTGASTAAPVIAAMIVGTAVHAIRCCLDDPTLDATAVAALTVNFLVGASHQLDPALFDVAA
jgi:AcrR family transcriptional regulator